MFDDYYSGCTLLKPFSDRVGIPVDRLNFVTCQLTGLCLAFFMRKFLHPSQTSHTVRHSFSFIVGLSLSYFCFGNEVIHLFLISTSCYLFMKFQSPKIMQNTIFMISMSYLAIVHLKRLIYNYGAYNLDITGPIMVMVQRVSGLAFSLHDGLACDPDKLSPYRKKYLTKKQPSFIEYYGYLFQFQSILAGPNILFQDYTHFIDGSNFKNAKIKDVDSEPSGVPIVLRKFTTSVLCIVFYMYTSSYFSMDIAKGNEFINEWSALYQVCFIVTSTTLTRFMYYHAWILAEAVCNASGLGFNGFDENGNAKWDLASNVNVIRVEFSDNIRNAIGYWNTGTNAWLRFLVYERMEKYERYKTLCTFLLSAVWHGFYPGYYICFTTAALVVSAARIGRKLIRPYFLVGKNAKMGYNFLTFVLTRISLAYFTFPFIMYDFWPAIFIFKRTLFFIHVGSLFLIFGLPALRKFLPKHPTAVVN